MKPDRIGRTPAIIAGIISIIQTVIAAPFPANRTPNGWEEVPLVDALGTGSALHYRMSVNENEVAAILDDGRVVILNEADASVRLITEAPADFPTAIYEKFGDAHAFIQGKLVVATLVGPHQIRIDELDIHTGAWLRSSTQTTTLYPQSLQPPVLEGDILTVYDYIPSAGKFQWNQSDWSVHAGAPAAANPGMTSEPNTSTRSLAGTAVIPANELHIETGLHGTFMQGLSIFDPKRLGVEPVLITMPVSEYDYAGASKSALWLMDSSAIRGNGMRGMICRFPITPMPQVVEIKLTNAKAAEHDGVMRFKITASPAPALPVTVELETEAGSAEEGADYAPWSGNIVLTSATPSAEVSIKLLEDQKLEWYETFLLKVKNVSNAWCFDRDAVGVIKGTAFARTVGKEPLPEVEFYALPKVAGTPAGILVFRQNNNRRGYRLMFCAAGSSNWMDWTSKAPFIKQWWYPEIEYVKGNLVCISGVTDHFTSTSKSIAIIDTSSASLVSQGTIPNNSKGIQMRLNGSFTTSPSPESDWSKTHSNSASPAGIQPQESLLATTPRGIQLPLGSESGFDLVASGDGIHVFDDDGLFIHRFAEDGTSLYQYLPDLSGEVMVGSSKVCYVEGTAGIRAVDPETGAILAWIDPPRNDQGFDATAYGEDLIVAESAEMISVIVARPGVPIPVAPEIVAEELPDTPPLEVDLTETVSFPLTSKLISSSMPNELTGSETPVVTPTGSRKLILPFRIADDDVPERREKLTAIIEVSGNGHSERFEITITIGGNDTLYFLNQKDSKLIHCSALDIGGGAPFVGVAVSRACYDPVKRVVYHPSLDEVPGRFYGHAVACSKSLAVVGAPAIGDRAVPSLVYLYDRKNDSRIGTLSHNAPGSAFGAVIHLDGERLYIGAPGERVTGEVKEFSAPGAKWIRSYREPGKARIGNRFGVAITNDKDHLWIGASGSGRGKVYEFAIRTGKLERIIQPAAAGTENFGHALSVVGPYLAVGSPSKTKPSSVSLYHRKTGKLAKSIQSPFGDGGHFGACLANLKEDNLAVGCPSSGFGYGGILIYDVRSNPCRMKVMLEPSIEPTAKHGQRYGVAGFTGSLCSFGDFLGIRVQIVDNPLRVMEGNSASNGYAEILQLKFPESKSKSALVEKTEATVWSQALGLEPGDPLPELHLQWENDAVDVSLPDLENLSSASTVFLESSEDLATWSPVARYSGSGHDGWVSLSTEFPITRHGEDERLRAMLAKRMFFRLKCETNTEY